MKIIIDEWVGCYPSAWKGMIVPDAITHPAKFSSKLIRRIYEHMRAEGWASPGDTIIDPFGGVALGALDAMRLGLKWRGVELEAKFADLGNANIALWNSRFRTMPNWSGDAALLHGDSRELAKVLTKAGIVVSSPPYADCIKENEHGSGIDWDKVESGGHKRTPAREAIAKGYSISGALSSPPYSEARIGQESGQEHCGHGDQYGATPGQLGAMKANGFDAAISSPPFKGQSADGGWQMLGKYAEEGKLTVKQVKGKSDQAYPSWSKERDTSYGKTDGQLANEDDDDFWTAARTIVDQVYQVLIPGGHAVWVCKDFVKNKQIVPFCDQWRQMCEAAGFVTLHEHHAMLVHSTEHDFDGKEKRRESKSFFRRLAENKGSPRIDYEVVLCMSKD